MKLLTNVSTKHSIRGTTFEYHTTSKMVALSTRLIPTLSFYKIEYVQKTKDFTVQFRF